MRDSKRYCAWFACWTILFGAVFIGCSRQAAEPTTSAHAATAPKQNAGGRQGNSIVSKDPRQAAVKQQASGSKKVTVKVPWP